ncbi:MAG: sulfite exporter TauE/SafE family protein [Candidatus Uhrbacteria bacterium]|nr:sulfite exporter TauE/SafE family protein [Candidatus Uhrbacteria bacterium]
MQSFTFISALLLGFVAGSSSCLAVSGGLLLSMIGKSHDRLGAMSKSARMRFTWSFVIGRIAAYTILGGVIGIIGSSFTFSPWVTGVITLLAAAYMIIAGLEMLQMAPNWLKCAIPRPPKWLSNKILDSDGNPNPFAPFLLGAATFFLPCGFTQSLQIYALTTASFTTGALILGAFAIGTAPALLALGFASGALNGKTGKFVLKIAGVFILYLAMGNIQNGLTLLGHPISFASAAPSAGYRVTSTGIDAGSPTTNTQAPILEQNGVQQLRLAITDTAPFYAPSNQLTATAGKPVHLEIDGVAGGCRSVFQIPGVGVQMLLNQEKNVVDFTPTKPGSYPFSCSMGMYRGTLNVL